MAKTRIIYRQILIFLVFAALIVVPLTFTIVKQVNMMILQEEREMSPQQAEGTAHREFSSKLLDQIAPFVFYILVMALMLSIFFSRRMLISLKGLQRGSQAMKDGNLDIQLEVTSDDELGDVTRAFNEMVAALNAKTAELKQKDVYVNAMLDPLWVVDEENTIQDINPAFTRLFGYSREQVVGSSIYDFCDERNAAIIRGQMEQRRDRGMSSIYELSLMGRDGSTIPVLVSGSPILSGDRIVGRIGILKDFRDQKELRNELQHSKEYAETVMDSIEDQLIVIDKDYRIVRANRRAVLESRGQVIGEFCHIAAHERGRPCWTEGRECPAQMVFITGQNYRTTHEHVGRAGERRFHEIVASPIKDAAGNVLHVIELIRDVTERMKHEEEIFNKNRELIALNSVASLLNKSLRPEEIFSKVLDKMIEMIRMDGGGIFFIDEMKREMTCQYHRGISDEFIKTMGRIRLGEDIPGRVAVSGQVLTTSDLSKDHRIERSIIKHSGIKGYCCIPIRGKERIIGVFCLFSFRVHVFSTEEVNILNSLGEMTGVALENVRLYEKMRELYEQQRRRREEEQSQILSISTKLGSALELKDVLGSVLDVIRTIFNADFAWLLLSDAEGNLVLKSAAFPTGGGNEVIYPRGVSSIEGYAVDRKAPTVIADIRAETKFFVSPVLSHLAAQSVIAVPMHIGDKTVGAFALYYVGLREFREEELHFLRIIVNILAVSIERADYYVRAIVEKGLSDTILQSVADGIMTVDRSSRIIAVNKAFERMTGMPAPEAFGLPVCDVFRYSVENMDFRLALGECMEGALEGRRASMEADMVSASGYVIPVLISSSPVLDSAGTVTGVVNLLRDISKEKEMDRMKTDLIRSVSHEFRTPLSAIVGMTEMILEGDVDDARLRKYLHTILSEGVRLSNMVSDLLSIARIESGKETLRRDVIDVNAFLGHLTGSFSASIKQKGARVGYDVDAVRNFVGDEEKLTQVLMNLMDNALTFSDEGCIVEITVKRRDDILEIALADNGWGIDEADIPHLTERFFRGSHKDKVKGTGLGLALCSDIIRMHGGTMRIESAVGVGTTVLLSLPYKESI